MKNKLVRRMLLSMERYILIKDPITQAVKDEIRLDINLDKLIKILQPCEESKLLKSKHHLTSDQVIALSSYTQRSINLNLGQYLYILVFKEIDN